MPTLSREHYTTSTFSRGPRLAPLRYCPGPGSGISSQPSTTTVLLSPLARNANASSATVSLVLPEQLSFSQTLNCVPGSACSAAQGASEGRPQSCGILSCRTLGACRERFPKCKVGSEVVGNGSGGHQER